MESLNHSSSMLSYNNCRKTNVLRYFYEMFYIARKLMLLQNQQDINEHLCQIPDMRNCQVRNYVYCRLKDQETSLLINLVSMNQHVTTMMILDSTIVEMGKHAGLSPANGQAQIIINYVTVHAYIPLSCCAKRMKVNFEFKQLDKRGRWRAVLNVQVVRLALS